MVFEILLKVYNGNIENRRMYKLCFYVPAEQLETVKQALFNQGAGRTELYDQCCWQVLGKGQFRPLNGSSPFLGLQGELCQLEEYKVEMFCQAEVIESVEQELLRVHPYQQPAYEIYRLETKK